MITWCPMIQLVNHLNQTNGAWRKENLRKSKRDVEKTSGLQLLSEHPDHVPLQPYALISHQQVFQYIELLK